MSNPYMDPAFASLVKQPRDILRDPHAVRRAAAAANQESGPLRSDPDLEIQDCAAAPTADQETPLSVRIYRRKNVMHPLPVLLYLHGGGFFCGDLNSDATQCAHYALNAHCAVVAVAYRLAPEQPFPAAFDDCYRALEFLWNQSLELNLDRGRVAIGGSSAGTLRARDRNGPKICFQMLLVPALDDRLETQSAQQFTDVPDFARPEAEVMWRWYLGDHAADVSPYASPARANDLSGLPNAYILCAGLDPLRDEGLTYAHRLTEAGVAVELHLVPSIPHGFASIPSAAISKRLLMEQVKVLCSALRTHGQGS
jgi:acetyl esterase